MSARVFWTVWNERGRAPTVKHWTEAAALTEAERLARHVPGAVFYVLRATTARQVRPTPVAVIDVVEEAEIPF